MDSSKSFKIGDQDEASEPALITTVEQVRSLPIHTSLFGLGDGDAWVTSEHGLVWAPRLGGIDERDRAWTYESSPTGNDTATALTKYGPFKVVELSPVDEPAGEVTRPGLDAYGVGTVAVAADGTVYVRTDDCKSAPWYAPLHGQHRNIRDLMDVGYDVVHVASA
ncbi:MAG: hypothetical protein ACRCZD_12625 [Phycicoccus sp.]